MTDTVQDLIAKTPPGGHVDLGAGGWKMGSTDPKNDRPAMRAEKPITITGNGAQIHFTRSSSRDRKSLRVRGPGVNLLGDVTLVHDDYLTGDRPDLEGQSGIEFQGATDFVCTWKVHAAAGSNFYFGLDPVTHAPCKNGWLEGIQSSRAGRQHLALQAVENLALTNYTLDSIVAGSQHSAIAFEPNSAAWSCKHVHARNGVLKGPRAWSFSSSAMYDNLPLYNLDDVLFDGLTSPDLPLSVMINHGKNTRKRGFVARNWRGSGELHQAGIRCYGVDNLEVTDYHQPYRGITAEQLFNVNDCPGALLTLAAS